jgi:hypothetical protein
LLALLGAHSILHVSRIRVKQSKNCTSVSTFISNLLETQRKMKETTGRKHKKERTKDGRDEAEIPGRDALKFRESIRDGKIAGRCGTRYRVR